MTNNEISYLVRRANRLGLQGQVVLQIILPSSATQSLEHDTVFVVKHRDDYNLGSADMAPWDE